MPHVIGYHYRIYSYDDQYHHGDPKPAVCRLWLPLPLACQLLLYLPKHMAWGLGPFYAVQTADNLVLSVFHFCVDGQIYIFLRSGKCFSNATLKFTLALCINDSTDFGVCSMISAASFWDNPSIWVRIKAVFWFSDNWPMA